MTRHDETRLKSIIQNHKRYTNSALATRILDDWENMRGKFVKVMPVDYKRALQTQYAAQQVDEAQTQEVSNG